MAAGFRLLEAASVTFPNKGAVTWVWGVNAKFQGGRWGRSVGRFDPNKQPHVGPAQWQPTSYPDPRVSRFSFQPNCFAERVNEGNLWSQGAEVFG